MSDEPNLGEPIRPLDHLHPALRRRVEEPWRTRREIGRKNQTPPQVVEIKSASRNGQSEIR